MLKAIYDAVYARFGYRKWPAPAKTYTPNGKREVARRLRQIQKGQLKVSSD